MYIKQNTKGYYELWGYIGGKDKFVKHLSKDPAVAKAMLRDLEMSKEATVVLSKRPDLLPARTSQAILAESKKAQIGKLALPDKRYRAIVIDPPWPMDKILRDERTNQKDFDYATMSIDGIKALPVATLALEDGCHIYLWTTQKFLPIAFEVFDSWGVSYQCLMTWVKNVGFTPFSWMYSTEHCLFGRFGSLPLLKMGMRLDFAAKVREHSRKPDEFYELVKQASPEPRLDWFSREKREGFDQYGVESDKF